MPTLENWESRLKPFFESRLRIIGEIPLSEADLDEIADLIKGQIRPDNFRGSTRDITQKFPLSFMTLLAHFSARNDQQGYWNTLADRFGTEVMSFFNAGWNTKFLELCQLHQLKFFSPDVMRTAYVATIRFHGGIPTYSLPDFFERMVVPAVTKPELRHIPAKDALDYLLKHVHFVDKPVLDFLENSGDMGLAWFEACCKLVRHAKENHGEVLPISSVPELPYNIHAFFERFNDEQEERGFHWSRPYLEVNPLSDESPVVLRIPEQQITTQAASQMLQWTITWPDQAEPIIIPCEVRQRGSGEFVPDGLFPVPTPSSQITISISSVSQGDEEESELRRWTLPLLPPSGQAPLAAFRNNGRHVPNAQSLPAQVLYLLTPKTAAMEVDPTTTERIDSFSSFSGVWKDWKLELWDLTSAISLLLHQDGQVLGSIVPVAREVEQPELRGGHRFDYQENLEQPLYTSEIPLISIPTAVNSTIYQALRDWKLRVSSLGEAAPKIDRQVSMLDHQADCLFEGSRAMFPLAALLGEKPAGSYEIKISGSHGIKADYRVRLWPKLLLQNYSKELPRAEESREPIKFNIYLQEGAWVETQTGALPVDITRDGNSFAIQAQPELLRIELDLVTTSSKGEQIRVPVSIPVVRLRWGLIEENSPSMLAFSQSVIHISKERFSQYASSALHVEMHGLGEMTNRLSCQLVEADNEENLLQWAEFHRTGFRPDWLKVSLEQFSTTIQRSNTQVQFQLVYQKDPHSPLIRYALMEVSPEMDVRDASLENVSECDWKLTWVEDLPLKNRRVMLRSAWQPWAPVIEQKIPDENRGEYILTDLALPPSSYEIFFYTKFKWEAPSFIPPENATCLKVNLISPVERLAFLETAQQGPDAQFRQLIEKACILDSLEEKDLRDEAVSASATCLVHLKDLKTLIGATKWIKDKDIQSAYKSYFRKNMFHQRLVEAMLDRYPQGDANLVEYLHMITKDIYADSAKVLLKKVDDPLVTSTCMKALLARKDADLLGLIISMIAHGRITADSAAELIAQSSEQSLWALEIIAGLNQSAASDSLLRAVLPCFIGEDNQTFPAWLQDALLRGLTIETSREPILRYLQILIGLNNDEAWKLTLEKEELGQITRQDFSELIRLSPEKAYQALKQNDKAGRFSAEIQKLEEEFPQAAGLLEPGMHLLTPFGEAQIVSIKLVDGTVVQKAHKTDSNFILRVTGGTGLDKVEVDLDFSKATLEFKNAATIYYCNKCKKFFHPRQQKLNEHLHQSHPYEERSFEQKKGSIPFSLSDIQYANPTN